MSVNATTRPQCRATLEVAKRGEFKVLMVDVLSRLRTARTRGRRRGSIDVCARLSIEMRQLYRRSETSHVFRIFGWARRRSQRITQSSIVLIDQEKVARVAAVALKRYSS